MKKLYLFFAVLCALLGSQTANADISGGGKLYLDTGGSSYWSTSNPYFIVHFWNGSGGASTQKMTLVSGESQIYEVTVPSGTWSNCKFFRKGSDDTSTDSFWNQTNDLSLSSDKNCYKITGWGNNNVDNGEWTTYTPSPSDGYPTVELWHKSSGKVASYTGSGSSWSLASTQVNTKNDADGYRIRVYLNSSYYTEYTTSSGVDNSNFWIGTSSITAAEADSGYFVFGNDFTTGYVTGTLTLNTSTYAVSTFQFSNADTSSGGDDTDLPTACYVIGYVDGATAWNPNGGVELTKSGDGVFTGTVTIEAKSDAGHFCVATGRSSDWTTFNNTYRYGPSGGDRTVAQSGVASAMTTGGLAWCVSQTGSYEITVDFSAKTMTLVYEGSSGGGETPSVDLSKVNMPLKEADFAGGKAHYFVVGTRMSEWRLQPEWELQPQADGTYTLENRLLYTGKMGIAKVDNYEDYCLQRYEFYSQNTYQKSGETYTVSLSKQTNSQQNTDTENGTMFTAIRYNDGDTHGQFTTEKTFRFEYTGDLNDAGILQSTPTLVGKMTLTLSSGTPTSFVMSSITNEASEIAKYRTFSLVGSDINYSDAGWASATPLQLNSSFNETAWEESWIQYDNYGMPYVDGYGNTIYQTVFQREWLASHPSFFRTSDGFEYNSINMVLNYDASITHDNSIGDDEGETAKYHNAQGQDGTNTRTASSGWQCFQLENMWLGGEFKVWTGWGGANKEHDGSEGNDRHLARWNYDNGGHGDDYYDWLITADKDTYYMTMRDVVSADFSLGSDRIFARYVRLWWDPSDGFDNSLIQIITEVGGPQIECKRSGKDQLSYTYSIPEDANGQWQNLCVKSYRIDRYRIGADGVLTLDKENVESASYTEAEAKKSNTIAGTDIVDQNPAEGGTYYYKITVEYYANAAIGEDTDFSRDAESNRVFIYYATIPEGASVRQLAYTTPDAATEASSTATEKYWSFDLAVNASAPSSLIGETFTKDGSEVNALSLVKYYVVAVPKLAGVENLYTGASDNAVAITSDNTDLASQITDFNFDSYTYFGLAPDADNYYAMPELTLHNVIPGNYTFRISMISVDSDETQWEAYNVGTATASVNMVKPGVTYTASAFKIEKCATNETMETINTEFDILGKSRISTMKFTNSNKISTTDGKFATLMVTDKVLRNWNVKYTVDTEMANPNTSENATYAYTLEGINGKKLNAEAGVTAQFTYLPMDYEKETAFTDCTIDVIKDVKKRTAKASSISTSTTAAYSRITGSTAYVSSDATTGSIEMDPSKDAFVNGSLLKGYELTKQLYIYQTQGSYNYDDEVYGSQYGSVSYFTNAFASFQWTAGTTLHNAVGFHSVSSSSGKLTGYTIVDPTDGQGYTTVTFPAAGGEVLRDSDNTDDYKISYDDDDSPAEAAAAAGKLPIKVWNVGDGQTAPSTTLYTAITADYPILINPTLTATLVALDEEELSTASVEDGVFSTGTIVNKVISLSYPQLLTKDLSDTTTEIDGIAADGASDLRIYPNPAVDVVNVAASSALGRVEIYSVDGRLVKVVDVDDTRAAIEVADLVKGSYIIRAAGATQRLIKN